MSIRALRQATRLTPDTGRLSIVQEVPLTPSVVESFVATPATFVLSPPSVVAVQEATPTTIEVSVPVTLAGSVVAT